MTICIPISCTLYPISSKQCALPINRCVTKISAKKLSEHLYRRPPLPRIPGTELVSKSENCQNSDSTRSGNFEEVVEREGVDWDADEIEAISSLFRGRIPQKPGKLNRERALPLPLPHRLRPLGFPTPKRVLKIASRMPVFKRVYKNAEFLVNLAREIKGLNSDEDVGSVLEEFSRFLRKGSLSLTIRELGEMRLPGRALQVFCWVQKQPHLFPDERVLVSTVEVLARNHELKVPVDVERFVSLASRDVIEAMIRGFIKGRCLNLGLKIFWAAKKNGITLGSSVFAKLILELGKNPDTRTLIIPFLDDLAGRETLDLSQLDCTAIMKICIQIRRFDIVETLFIWYKDTGRDLSIVMYTTVLHSRYCEQKYREAMALIWDMEAADCLFNLPAYRVVIKIFVAMKDLPRAAKYYSKLKDAGFRPTLDIYSDVIKLYLDSGRIAKCREICKEAEMTGFKLDRRITMQL